ncbi:hypothetical protein E4U53_003574 [Claviceps sorghi]|nr:hypothetical protein E4U53_003574 [Claviceps sorghi]
MRGKIPKPGGTTKDDEKRSPSAWSFGFVATGGGGESCVAQAESAEDDVGGQSGDRTVHVDNCGSALLTRCGLVQAGRSAALTPVQ